VNALPTTRRTFLKQAATVAATLAGGGLSWAAAERNAGEAVPSRALPWYRRTLRWGQTNITDSVNLTNAGTWRQPVHELIPIGPFEVRVKAPADVRGRRARLLVSGKTIAASRTAGQCRFAIKSILDHEVVVIG